MWKQHVQAGGLTGKIRLDPVQLALYLPTSTELGNEDNHINWDKPSKNGIGGV